MFCSIWTATRPNTNVPFWNHTSEIRDYINENYVDTGLRIDVEVEFSQDELTRVTKEYWIDQAAFDTFRNDPFIINNLRDPALAHNAANGIVRSVDYTNV
jgi:uncharacterized radical SAM superfamily protein